MEKSARAPLRGILESADYTYCAFADLPCCLQLRLRFEGYGAVACEHMSSRVCSDLVRCADLKQRVQAWTGPRLEYVEGDEDMEEAQEDDDERDAQEEARLAYCFQESLWC